MGWSYQARYISCGKSSCGTCNEGGRHGPYWYGYQRIDGRVKSKYFGKKDPRATVTQEQRAQAKAPDVPSRYVRPKRMDWDSALRIMGFPFKPTKKVLEQRYRDLMNEHHPDHGGSTYVAASINIAYEYLVH